MPLSLKIYPKVAAGPSRGLPDRSKGMLEYRSMRKKGDPGPNEFLNSEANPPLTIHIGTQWGYPNLKDI